VSSLNAPLDGNLDVSSRWLCADSTNPHVGVFGQLLKHHDSLDVPIENMVTARLSMGPILRGVLDAAAVDIPMYSSPAKCLVMSWARSSIRRQSSWAAIKP
jgi:hypothetical protein